MLRPENVSLSDEVIDASMCFRQGDLLENVSVSFFCNADHRVTSLAIADDAIAHAPLQRAIITSQSCDLKNPKRMLLRPFVTIARVFDAETEFDKGRLGHIRSGRFGDVIPLTTEQLGTGTWVADLRVEGAIERGVLVGRDPIAGFRDEAGYLTFQEDIAAVRARQAIDDRVLEHVVLPLRERLEHVDAFDIDDIVEIRIRALPRLDAASSVELIFLVDDGVDPLTVQSIVDVWYQEIMATLPEGIQLLDFSVVAVSQFTRADEIGTSRLDFDDLSELSGEA